jgi:hypothetical protein
MGETLADIARHKKAGGKSAQLVIGHKSGFCCIVIPFPSMRPSRRAGPRRQRGAMREGDHPAWQGVTPDLTRQSDRKQGIPASRAKRLPRSAGV